MLKSGKLAAESCRFTSDLCNQTKNGVLGTPVLPVRYISKDGTVVKAELRLAAGWRSIFAKFFDNSDSFILFFSYSYPASPTAHRVGAAGGILFFFV